jgi:hypothetical protein
VAVQRIAAPSFLLFSSTQPDPAVIDSQVILDRIERISAGFTGFYPANPLQSCNPV